jgi:S1-C subfamily serine protease
MHGKRKAKLAHTAMAAAFLAGVAPPNLMGPGVRLAATAQSTIDGCGWIGVRVRPMTREFATALGMTETYGAIFNRPEPGSPAALAGIEEGDVVTAIDGAPLERSADFAPQIAQLAPGSLTTLNIFRNGEGMQVRLMVGSSPACSTSS